MTAERMLWCVLVGGTCGLASGLYHRWKERKAQKKRMRRIFVSSPYTAETPEDIAQNVERAQKIAHIVTINAALPLVPHIYCPQFLNDADKFEHCAGMLISSEWVEAADELWVIGREITSGMQDEIAWAFEYGIPIYCFDFEDGYLKKNEGAVIDDVKLANLKVKEWARLKVPYSSVMLSELLREDK